MVWSPCTKGTCHADGHPRPLAPPIPDLHGRQPPALRPERLVDVSKIDMTTEIFGQKLAAPLYLCPVGAQAMFHPEGEVAVARGAKSKNVVQALSTVTNYSVEDVRAARGAPGWYQLYS